MSESTIKVNREILIGAVNWAIAEHEKKLRGEQSDWEQKAWIEERRHRVFPFQWTCRTVCCIGGYIALNAGASPIIGRPGYVYHDGRRRLISSVASDVAGLGSDSLRLFDAFNTIEDIKRIANSILEEDYFQ